MLCLIEFLFSNNKTAFSNLTSCQGSIIIIIVIIHCDGSFLELGKGIP